MTPKELAERALESGLIDSAGATPDATMGAQLYIDIQKNPQSRFKKVGRGKFVLREAQDSAASAEVIIERQNELVRAALKARMFEMDPTQFEYLAGDLLKELGYENIQVLGKSGDKGVDLRAELTMGGITSVKTVVQVKRWRAGNNVSGSVIAQLRGSAEVDQRGLVITTSDFTRDGVAEASAPNKMPVALVNGDKLLDLMIKHGVGVRKQEVPVYSLDAEYFENAESEEQDSAPHGKNSALWPLPGGIYAYVPTLFDALDAVAANSFTKRDFVRWFMRTYEQVKSEKTAGGYVNVPRAIRLTSMENGRIVLTADGKRIQETKDLELLYSVFAKSILGIEEIMELLRTSPEPQTEADVMAFLKENLGVEWTTFAQVNFRLLWLVNLGKAERTDNGYTLKRS